MSNIVATQLVEKERQQKLRDLNGLLEKMKGQIRIALPRHMTPERLVRIALTAYSRSNGLQQCTPISVLGAVVQAAQLGLEPDDVLGHAYLVPYWNSHIRAKEAKLIVGYRGWLDLARRSGRIRAIDSRVVFSRDTWDYRLGLNPKLEHVPWPGDDRGEVTHAWAIAHFGGGGYQLEVMTRGEIDRVRASSQSSDSGPWVTHYEQMARKTVLRRLCKFLPLSPEIQRQISAEEMTEAGLEVSADVIDSMALLPSPEANGESNGNGAGPSDADPSALDPLRQRGNGSAEQPASSPASSPNPQAAAAVAGSGGVGLDDAESAFLEFRDGLEHRLAQARSEEEFQAIAADLARYHDQLGNQASMFEGLYRERHAFWQSSKTQSRPTQQRRRANPNDV